MTNYMGKFRLIKLFFHYISLRTEYVKSVKAAQRIKLLHWRNITTQMMIGYLLIVW